jgi:hypothetical protein
MHAESHMSLAMLRGGEDKLTRIGDCSPALSALIVAIPLSVT